MFRFPRPDLKLFMLSLAILGALQTLSQSCRAEDSAIVVKNGDKISFLGDSITASGAGNPAGYVRLVIAGLKVNGIEAVAMGAGVSGNTSKDMLARLERDVLTKKPTWMTLSCGVNDVWHGKTGVELPQYKINITSIIDKAQAAGIKVVVLTSTMIHEDPEDPLNKQLALYNEFLRSIAKEKGCLLADLNARMQEEVAGFKASGKQVTLDGVHMNLTGQQMMAAGVLKAFGLSDNELKKAQDSWLDMSGTVDLGRITVTVRQFEQLSELAAAKHMSVPDFLTAEFNKTVSTLLPPSK